MGIIILVVVVVLFLAIAWLLTLPDTALPPTLDPDLQPDPDIAQEAADERGV